jgi:hypothetical protein
MANDVTVFHTTILTLWELVCQCNIREYDTYTVFNALPTRSQQQQEDLMVGCQQTLQMLTPRFHRSHGIKFNGSNL